MKTWSAVVQFLAHRLAIAVAALVLAATVQAVTASAPPARAVVRLPERAPAPAQAATSTIDAAERTN